MEILRNQTSAWSLSSNQGCQTTTVFLPQQNVPRGKIGGLWENEVGCVHIHDRRADRPRHLSLSPSIYPFLQLSSPPRSLFFLLSVSHGSQWIWNHGFLHVSYCTVWCPAARTQLPLKILFPTVLLTLSFISLAICKMRKKFYITQSCLFSHDLDKCSHRGPNDL